MHGRSRMTIAIRPSHPYYAGTEHVGFSPTRQTLLAPSAKRREVFGESHERVNCTLPRTARETDLGTLCVLSCIWIKGMFIHVNTPGFRYYLARMSDPLPRRQTYSIQAIRLVQRS